MQFYILAPAVGSEAETSYEPVGPDHRGQAPRCPACGRFAGLRPWLPPYRARIVRHGRRLGDLAFDVGDELLVSARFLSAWQADLLQGIGDVEPVEIVAIQPQSAAEARTVFQVVRLTRGSTKIDRARSVFVGEPAACTLCGGPGPIEAILTLRIDEASWGGEDIFIPWGTANVMVTERVVRLAAAHDLANVTTTPIQEFRWTPLGTR